MSEMIVQVRNKMLRRIGGVNHFVSHNKDYTIQFQFDESWDNVRTKMAVFAYEDGEYGSEIFDGEICTVPELPKEGRILIGVKAGEDLSTELLCIPVCKSADDVITDEYDEPDPKIYEQILDIINNLWDGGTTVYPSPVHFLAAPNKAEVGQFVRVKKVDENGEIEETEAVDVEDKIHKKIDAPAGARVGDFLTVEEVDEDGVVKKVVAKEVETAPPDWDEEDSTRSGYIKNKTHYKYSEKLIGNIDFIATSENTLILKNQSSDPNIESVYDGIISASLSENRVIKVVVDGKIYTSNAYSSRYVASLANGEVSWDVGGPAGYKISLSINNDNVSLITEQEYKIEFYRFGEFYKPLDEKYFPDTIFTQNNAPMRFGKVSNLYNEPSAVQGYNTEATGGSSHAEGYQTKATGGSSHAEGYQTKAIGNYSHAEGYQTKTSGRNSHAEGTGTNANTAELNVSGRYNLTEDTYVIKTEDSTDFYYNNTTVYYSDKFTFNVDTGEFSLVDPKQDVASAISMIGKYCLTNSSTASWMNYIKSLKSSYSNRKVYNITIYKSFNRGMHGGTYASIVGNGNSDTERSNAYTLDWEGNAWFAGNVYVGSASGTNKDEGSLRLATEEDIRKQYTVNVYPNQDDSGNVTYESELPALWIYDLLFSGELSAGNSIICHLFPLEDDSKLVMLNFIGGNMSDLDGGKTSLSFKFSSIISGKVITAEIKDTISGFMTEDMTVVDRVVTVTEEMIGSSNFPAPATAQVGQIVKVKAVDADGKITETIASDFPTASPTTLGGVKPIAKTDSMTQEVGIDTDGRLYTKPSSSSGGSITFEQDGDYISITSTGVTITEENEYITIS